MGVRFRWPPVRRLVHPLRSDKRAVSDPLPAACYYSCALPGLIAQIDGKSGSSLCALPCYGNFEYTLEECRMCLVNNNSSQTTVIDAIPSYQQFIAFCSSYSASTTLAQCATTYAISTTPGLFTITTVVEDATDTYTSTSSGYGEPNTISTYKSITYPSVPTTVSDEGYVFSTTVSTSTGPLITITSVAAGSTIMATEAKTVFDIKVSAITTVLVAVASGLILCPSRITNTDYTAPTPFPSNYTWGCPPGSVCVPPRVNCDREVNLPAVNYSCSPDQCLQAPRLQNYAAVLPVTNDLFYLNPELFGLFYNIFEEASLTTLAITTERSTVTYTLSASTTTANTSLSSSTTVATTSLSSKPTAGIIAGATIGAVVGFAIILGLVIFMVLRKRRQQRRLRDETNSAEASKAEKAQLHSQDLKPDRKELQGEGGPRFLTRSTPSAEMAANEELIRREMPANELIGSELEVKQGAVSRNPPA